jgi:Domain of unknown function (DUF1707)/Cell wall-active antibiotics response 4TMS YvqF
MADNSWMDPHGFNENSRLRASDADRDQAASVINNAMAEGRLTPDEHAERLDAIYSAKTHAELAPLLDDLPERGSAAGPVATPSAAQPVASRRGSRIICFLSGTSRKGAWHPEPVIDVVTVLGGAELDFREAVLPGKEVTVRATTILGGVEITVPPEMRVIDNGVAILGGREITGGEESVGPDSPVLRIEGICLLGGMEVRRRTRKGKKSDKGIRISHGQPGQIEDVLGQVRERRHEIRSQVRAQRHEIRNQIRDRRFEIRTGWTDDDDND